MKLKSVAIIASCVTLSFALVVFVTSLDLRPVPDVLSFGDQEVWKPQLFDRTGFRTLLISYQNQWSVHTIPLHEIPVFLQNAFIQSEDRLFMRHGGVDWLARVHALTQNVIAMRGVRGASTITEQVVRMLHRRPRTVWSRWLEGIEAAHLEKRFSKNEILEFYLNQVPYGHQRRGIVEAARFYFDRDPATLNVKEMLALAVLVRAPSNFDLRRRSASFERRLARLAAHMHERRMISDAEYSSVLYDSFEFAHSGKVVEAPQFVQYVLGNTATEVLKSKGKISTSLDGRVQQ